jgi:alkylation response protein AidB-like acyl-CoA dehydrogenase
MSLVLTEEEVLLTDTAKDFFAQHSPVAKVRDLRADPKGLGYDSKVWQQMIEMGWSAIPFPEEVGGLGFSYQGLGSIFEVSGITLAASPLLNQTVLSGECLLNGANPDQISQYLERLISGEDRWSLAIDEFHRHAPHSVATVVKKSGDTYTLSGKKVFCFGAVGATHFIVSAIEDGSSELSLWVVQANTPGITVSPFRSIDHRNMANVQFDQVAVKQADKLSGTLSAKAALDLALDKGRACLSGELLGITQTVFDMTIEYMKQRIQFDRPIASFQALQHRAALMYTQIELARSAVKAAFEAIDTKDSEMPKLVSLAKALSSSVAELVTNEAIQLHGGIGVTDEYDLGFYLKRARVAQASLGDVEFHQARYASLINL